MRMKFSQPTKWLLIVLLVFAMLQLARPSIDSPHTSAELNAPPAVKMVLEKGCFSCHSDRPRLSWFDEVVPVYWLARHDIVHGRSSLDFSTLGSQPAAVQKASLFESYNFIQMGDMPLPAYSRLHPEARLTPEDVATLRNYLNPWSGDAGQSAAGSDPKKIDAALRAPESEVATRVAFPEHVQPEFNGLSFDQSFDEWKLISTTDRGDNGTLRLVLGNDVAVRAAEAGHISPWPDGTRFAKIAWKKQAGADGLVHPGAFVQVELMVKNAQQFPKTDGWNWGRWTGSDLRPWGKDAHFVNSCTGCHHPVRGDDYVYTQPITSAVVSGNEVVNNAAAALSSKLPYQPLRWRPITMYVDETAATTAVLFGNTESASAVQEFLAAQKSSAPAYSPGSLLALVTWGQRDDPHWFGARIPGMPLSVEIVGVGMDGKISLYKKYERGTSDLRSVNISDMHRAQFIEQLKPVSLP